MNIMLYLNTVTLQFNPFTGTFTNYTITGNQITTTTTTKSLGEEFKDVLFIGESHIA